MNNCALANLSLEDLLLLSESRSPIVRMRPSRILEIEAYVYVVIPETEGVCKIGVAEDLAFRISGLQVGAWERLSCYSAITIVGADPFKVERLAHKKAEAQAKRLSGEWFAIEPDVATACIIEAAKEIGAAYSSPTRQYVDADIARELAHRKSVDDAEKERRAIMRRKLGMD